MRVIDGARGEGGGQVLRTALGLAALRGFPVRIENVRAGRKKPGLLRQHRCAAQAVAAITGGELEGGELGSRQVTFRPGPVRPGRYFFAVGSAGSATLVLQTVLPALMMADEPSQLTLEGGTHNPKAPPFEYLVESFLPLLARMGPRVTAVLRRTGFYPAGGGQLEVVIEPASKLKRLDLVERGELGELRARILSANLPPHVAKREKREIKRVLGLRGGDVQVVEPPKAPGPGNAVSVLLEYPGHTQVFTAFGAKGRKAEAVAGAAAREARRYLEGPEVVAGEHLADQLLLPFALAGGGRVRCGDPTLHARTQLDLVGELLAVKTAAEEVDEGLWELRVG